VFHPLLLVTLSLHLRPDDLERSPSEAPLDMPTSHVWNAVQPIRFRVQVAVGRLDPLSGLHLENVRSIERARERFRIRASKQPRPLEGRRRLVAAVPVALCIVDKVGELSDSFSLFVRCMRNRESLDDADLPAPTHVFSRQKCPQQELSRRTIRDPSEEAVVRRDSRDNCRPLVPEDAA